MWDEQNHLAEMINLRKVELDVEPLFEKLRHHLEKTGYLERAKEAYQIWLDIDGEMMNESYRFIRGLGLEDFFGEGAATQFINIFGDRIMGEIGQLQPKEALYV